MKKAIFHLDAMVAALEQTKKAKVSNPVAPVLANWLVEFNGEGSAKVTATDTSVFLSVDLPCECTEKFTCLVPPNALNLLKKMDPQPVVLEYNDTNHDVVFKGEEDTAKFNGDDHRDFPVGHTGGKKTVDLFTTDSKVFTELGTLSDFMSDDLFSLRMNGVNFSYFPEGLELCATNGHLLATSLLTEFKGKGSGPLFILRNKAVVLLSAYAPKKKEAPGNVGFSSVDDGAWIVVRFGNMTMGVKGVSERFPDYRSVIPKESTTQFKGNKANLLKQLDKALVCANASTRQVKFSLGHVIKLSSSDLDLSSNFECNLQGIHSGARLEIGFNGVLLKKVLSNLVKEEFLLQMTVANRAGVIREDNRTFLVMPIMLNQYA